MLDGGENSSAKRPRKSDRDKELLRIDVVFPRLVDDAELTVSRRIPVRKELIDLAPLERRLVAVIPDAKYELLSIGHVSQDNA